MTMKVVAPKEAQQRGASRSPAARGRRGAIGGLLEKTAVLQLLILLIVVFAVEKPELFVSTANIRTLLQSQAIIGVVALATIVPLITGHFDLSVGTNLTLTSLITAKAMASYGLNVVLAVLLGLLVGLLIGAINGVFVAYLRVTSLIVTLAMATALSGVVDLYVNGQVISEGLSTTLTNVGTRLLFGVPMLFVIMLIIALFIWYLVVLTPWGKRLTAIGSNENAARFVGIRVDRSIFLSFALAGLLGGVAGVLQIASQGSASPTTGGITIMLPALAGAFLGATLFWPGRYNVPGTLVGLFFVAVLVNGMALVGANPALQPIVNGGAVIVAVTSASYLRRRRAGT